MKQLSSVDLYFLVREFKIFENQRIDNFYFENDIFYLKVYVKNRGNLFLTNKVSKYIYVGDNKGESSHPPNFIVFLRKYLKNGYIREVKQVESERILIFRVEKKNEKEELDSFYLIIELFANGNVIVCDEDFNIKNSLYKKKFKDRSLMVHNKYELPPQKKLRIESLDKKMFEDERENSDLNLVKFLAIKLGMGGKYAEEVCIRGGVDKNKEVRTIDKSEADALINALEELRNEEIKPFGVYKDSELFDFIPFDFNSIDLEKKSFESFNEVIKKYYLQFEVEVDKNEEKLKKELERLQRRLETQKEQKEKVLEEYEKYNKMGEKIYENYALIDELLTSINNAAKEKGWEHVKNTIKENPKLSKLVDKLDYKNNEIILELE